MIYMIGSQLHRIVVSLVSSKKLSKIYDKITIDGGNSCNGQTSHLPAVRRHDAQNEEDRQQHGLATSGADPVYFGFGRPVLLPSGHRDRSNCYDPGQSTGLFEAEGVVV